MDELITTGSPLTRLITKTEDRSSGSTSRMRLTFSNGFGISIIRGLGTYGSEQGLYEVAPLRDDRLDGSIIGWFDDVKGHLTRDEVYDIAVEIANL